MGLKSVLRKSLHHGFRLFGYDIRIAVQKSDWRGHLHPILLRQIHLLVEKFPECRTFMHPSIEEDPEACEAVFNFLNRFIATFHPASREPHLRTLLAELLAGIATPEFRTRIEIEIAKSRLRSGDSDAALILRTHPDFLNEHPEETKRLEQDLVEFEQHYGAKAPFFDSMEIWRKSSRGKSLIYLFSGQKDSLRSKNVLHIAPEKELEKWLRDNAQGLSVEYMTLDGIRPDTDLQGDLCSLPIADDSYDLIICHRVLEHILDDRASLFELHRVLRIGGTLQVSVPQSMHKARTEEWAIPDESLHGHVRQYGRDFEDRLHAAGFKVEVDRTLLDLPLEEHRLQGTMPMRIYRCMK